MEFLNIPQQMIAFQKQSIKSFQGFWNIAQDQTFSTVDRVMDQTTWMPRESRQALESWRTLMNQERERFSTYVDQCFAIYETMLDAPQAAMPAKAKKTSDAK